jgi:hypothetical protein
VNPASQPEKPACRAVSLYQLKRGQSGVIRESALSKSDAALLAAMGLCCIAKVRLCREGEPCIVAILGGRGAECRIGLAKSLAQQLHVEVVVDGPAVS